MGKLFSQKRYAIPLLSFVILFIIAATTYLFRNAIGIFLIDHYARDQHVSVNCLSFDIDTQLNIELKEVCLQAPGIRAKIEDALFSYQKNALYASSLIVHHTLSKNTDKASSSIAPIDITSWKLPVNLPKVTIDEVTINSDVLRESLNFSLIQPTPDSLKFEGDIQATLSLTTTDDGSEQSAITADIKWVLSEVIGFVSLNESQLASLNPLLNQTSFMNTQIITHLRFDGNQLSSKHSFNTSFHYHHNSCSIQPKIDGLVVANFSLLTRQLSLDISALDTRILLGDDCLALLPQVPIELPNVFSLTSPTPMLVTLNGAVIPSLSFTDENKALALTLIDLGISFPKEKSPIHIETKLELDGELNLNKPAKPSERLARQSPLSSLTLSHSGYVEADGQDWSVSQIDGVINVQNFTQAGLTNKTLSMNASGSISSQTGITMQLTVDANGLRYLSPEDASVPITIKSVQAALTLSGKNINEISVISDSTWSQIKRDTVLVNKLSNRLKGNVSNFNHLHFSGDSTLSGIAINVPVKQYLTFSTIDVRHDITAQRTSSTLKSQHDVSVEKSLQFTVGQAGQQINLMMHQQSIDSLQAVATRFLPELILQDGTLNIDAQMKSNGQDLLASIELVNAGVKYSDFSASGIATHANVYSDSAGLQLDNARLTILNADTGVPISNIALAYSIKNNSLKVDKATGNVLGGNFILSGFWLDNRNQNAQLTMNNIDLAKIVELQQQSGIDVTGSVSGTLPLTIKDGKVNIDKGLLKSDSAGALKIDGNPAFDSIAQQQTELNYLKDLEYEKLSSKVKLNTDGLLFLDFSILGKNPTQQQAVNFNYHHEENILTLMRSLRLTDSVQNQIEHKIKKGGEE